MSAGIDCSFLYATEPLLVVLNPGFIPQGITPGSPIFLCIVTTRPVGIRQHGRYPHLKLSVWLAVRSMQLFLTFLNFCRLQDAIPGGFTRGFALLRKTLVRLQLL
jgi:hypothetical protein